MFQAGHIYRIFPVKSLVIFIIQHRYLGIKFLCTLVRHFILFICGFPFAVVMQSFLVQTRQLNARKNTVVVKLRTREKIKNATHLIAVIFNRQHVHSTLKLS